MMRKLVPALIMTVAVAGGAHAACAQFTASSIDVTYDPLGMQSASQVVQPVVLFATRGSGGGVGAENTAQFVDQESGSVRVGTNGPLYTIMYGSSMVVVPRNAAPLSPGNTFSFRFSSSGGGAEQVSGLQFIIDPGLDVAAGVYSESLDIQMKCGGSGGNQPIELQSGVLHISVSVPSTLIASLAGGSASGTLDFGDFSDPARTAMVNVYSTGPYALSIASDNNGYMKLLGAPPQAADASNARIAYTLTFDGRPVSTAASVHFERTGVNGRQLPLAVTAESVAGKRAGTYHDSIIVTFTPLATL